MEDWVELHGDRAFGDDAAIVAGLRHLPRPLAWRSSATRRGAAPRSASSATSASRAPRATARRCASCSWRRRFGLPVLTLIDTAGAYPGLDAEERGQAEAIARNLMEMAVLRVPIVVDRHRRGGQRRRPGARGRRPRLILEYAIYSVISPEGCAAILWKDQETKAEAAEAMRITAPDLLDARRRRRRSSPSRRAAPTPIREACRRVGDAVERALRRAGADARRASCSPQRYQRFRRLGVVSTRAEAAAGE